jgi:hypothetical protein
LMDGSTVEYAYAPGETRHESYGPGEFKVHDLENIGDGEMVFMGRVPGQRKRAADASRRDSSRCGVRR